MRERPLMSGTIGLISTGKILAGQLLVEVHLEASQVVIGLMLSGLTVAARLLIGTWIS